MKINKYRLAFINLLDYHFHAPKDCLDYKLLKELVDKQTMLTPTYKDVIVDVTHKDNITKSVRQRIYSCPCCNYALSTASWDINGKLQGCYTAGFESHYCKNCGQAINWDG